MTTLLKKLMSENNFVNEAEMFCTDLEFRADYTGQTSKYSGDRSKNIDDIRRHVERKLDDIIELFKGWLAEIELDEFDKEFSKAICVYFACYFRLDNEYCIEIYNLATDEEKEGLDKFWGIKKRTLEKET